MQLIHAAWLRGKAQFANPVALKEPVTFAVVAGLLLLTALLAGYVPGRRAATTVIATAPGRVVPQNPQ